MTLKKVGGVLLNLAIPYKNLIVTCSLKSELNVTSFVIEVQKQHRYDNLAFRFKIFMQKSMKIHEVFIRLTITMLIMIVHMWNSRNSIMDM